MCRLDHKQKGTCCILESVDDSLSDEKFFNLVSLVCVSVDLSYKLGLGSYDLLIDFVLFDF